MIIDPGDGPRVDELPKDLLEEEGIALRTSFDRIEQRDGGAMAEDGGPARNNDAFVIPTMR